jgi:serine/threonine protein kinase
MEGGDKIGEGAQGIAYNVCGEESLCSILENMRIDSIEIYDATSHKKVEDIPEFLKSLKKMKKYLIKIFKPWTITAFHRAGPYKSFTDELAFNKEILNVVPENLLSLSDEKVGIHVKGSKEFYGVFIKYCNNKFAVKTPKKFIRELLEVLVYLEKDGYYHNDIKSDNIVQCNQKYRLIDWGALSKKIAIKTSKTTSPMKLYVDGYSSLISRGYFAKNNCEDFKPIKNTAEFKEQKVRIITEFNEEINQYTRADLKKKFDMTHDIFQLGITLLMEVITNKLDYSKYRDLIEKLASLKNPLKASEAMSLVS